jgi:hypothetical protein
MRNKTGGRTAGTPNKITADIRESLRNFVESNILTVQQNFDALEPKDKLKFLSDILPFILPKMQSVVIEPETKRRVITLDLGK